MRCSEIYGPPAIFRPHLPFAQQRHEAAINNMRVIDSSTIVNSPRRIPVQSNEKETLRFFLCLNEQNISLVAICTVI